MGVTATPPSVSSSSPIVYQNATFPVPVIIPFAQLGLQGSTAKAAANLFMRVIEEDEIQARFGFDPSRGRTDVYPVVAFRAARRLHFGRKTESDDEKKIWETLSQRFFPGISFFGGDGRVLPIEVKLREKNPFPDGDTASIKHFRVGNAWHDSDVNALLDGSWADYSASVRMDGVDTPESYRRSEKYERHQVGLTNYLQMRYAVPDKYREALKALVGARIAYLGKVAGAVTYGFGSHFAEIGIRLAPAYSLKGVEVGLDDTLDIWDKYGRLIGRILAGRDNEGEDLLAGFLEFVLPGAMRYAEETYLTAYKQEVAPHDGVLREWTQDRQRPQLRELYGILRPGTAPIPTRKFSERICQGLARIWRDFVAAHPEAKNDLQTLTSIIGTGPPYPKYPGHLARLDLRAEQIALGATKLSKGHGLTRDVIFQLLRPSAEEGDPHRSLAYSDPAIGKYMSGIDDMKDLDPLGLYAEVLRRAIENAPSS